MFVIGLVWFTVASVLCGLAPSIGALIAARALQGVGGALLVPGSLALITASFRSEDHGSAIGAWSGLTGVATSIGPFLGGYLVDAVSWRLVFLINVPLAARRAVGHDAPRAREPRPSGGQAAGLRRGRRRDARPRRRRVRADPGSGPRLVAVRRSSPASSAWLRSSRSRSSRCA